MSLLINKEKISPTNLNERILDRYLEYTKKEISPNTYELRVSTLKYFNRYCFETLSNWDAANMKLVDLNDMMREILYDVKKEDWKELVYPGLLERLQDFIWWRNANGLSARSLRASFYHITEFLFWAGLRLDTRDIRRLKYPKLHKKPMYSLTMQEIERIIAGSINKRQILYMALISSGMRIGEALAIQKHQMKLVRGYFFVTIPSENTKTSSEREVILSQEVSTLVMKYWDDLRSTDRVFMRDVQPNPCGEAAIFGRLIRRLGIGTPDKHPTIHRFRAFFYKKASKTVDSDYAHMMLGHGGYLSTYAELEEDEKLNDYYMLAEPELTIQNYFKNKLKDTTLEDRIQELEIRNQELSRPQSSS